MKRLSGRPFRLITLLAACIAASAVGSAPVRARESLGLYATWGAFRDPLVPRCYAIAMAEPSQAAREYQPFAAIGTWPRRGARGQLHVRLSRRIMQPSTVTLNVGGQRWPLIAGGGDAWPRNEGDNAAIVAAMRSAPRMTVTATDLKGNRFVNAWPLAGAASAMDAALIGCAKAQ
ncbi:MULTISPECIES: hypothetical protein [Sphingomonadaceae]|uniref:hypothetical protein n=1 Tax=Sphingomonadaceae TaxID=41297 RepID=UPI001AF46A90|nr:MULTISPECIES: hypothetical protein [Sphingomonadaceae]QSR15846.1 hypothetical protein CA833_01305 [Novosphingobium sp. KA1]